MYSGPVDVVQKVIEYRGCLIYAGRGYNSEVFRATVVDAHHCYKTSTTSSSFEEVVRRAKHEVDQSIAFQRQWLREAIKKIEEERQS